MGLCVYLEHNVLNIYRKSKTFGKNFMQKHESYILLYPTNFLRNSYDFRHKKNSKRVKFVDNMRIFLVYCICW
jgi:hypothetical protein